MCLLETGRSANTPFREPVPTAGLSCHVPPPNARSSERPVKATDLLQHIEMHLFLANPLSVKEHIWVQTEAPHTGALVTAGGVELTGIEPNDCGTAAYAARRAARSTALAHKSRLRPLEVHFSMASVWRLATLNL